MDMTGNYGDNGQNNQSAQNDDVAMQNDNPSSVSQSNGNSTETGKKNEPIKTIKSIYLENDIEIDNKKIKNIKYFVGDFKEDGFVEIDGATAIEESAFVHSDVEKILFNSSSDVSPKSIDEKAFEGCESLTTVIFGELGDDETLEEKGKEKTILKNLTLASADGDFTIQANAFKGCANLTTLVLPKVTGTLTIEKDAFCGCVALCTVVAICGKVDFTGNPFASSPGHLTFICKKDSDVAWFAYENDYGSVYVEQ